MEGDAVLTTKKTTVTHANPQTPIETTAGGTQVSNPPVVDHETLRSLAAAIGWPKVGQFIADFTDHAHHHRESMRTALAAGDLDALYHSAHMLVSVSGSLGALATSRLCDRLQKAAQVADITVAQTLFDELDQAVDQALAELKELVAKIET